MSSGWEAHLAEIVLPAWQDYLSAEHKLSTAVKLRDDVGRRRQGYAALRHGAAAVLFLHHFGEVVLRARPPFLPDDVRTFPDLQEWLTGYCTHLRSDRIATDVLLLGDVAEALKHAPLAPGADEDEAVALDAPVLVVAGGRRLPSEEGKVDAIDQVVIQTRSGPRALSTVLQNVVDAWRRAAGMRTPEIGLP